MCYELEVADISNEGSGIKYELFLFLWQCQIHSFFFYKNIFYKNIEAEICEILRIL